MDMNNFVFLVNQSNLKEQPHINWYYESLEDQRIKLIELIDGAFRAGHINIEECKDFWKNPIKLNNVEKDIWSTVYYA